MDCSSGYIYVVDLPKGDSMQLLWQGLHEVHQVSHISNLIQSMILHRNVSCYLILRHAILNQRSILKIALAVSGLQDYLEFFHNDHQMSIFFMKKCLPKNV